MKQFLDENFLLNSTTAEKLYHGYAADMPIIDYHCHLSPKEIAEDKQFDNLTQIWLNGDHYKWRAMRTNGIEERFITGTAPDNEKFEKWASTVPYTIRNPLYHWTHLELQRYFGITDMLNEQSAPRIYEHCTGKLQTPDFSVKNILRKMNVAVVCTTDDPIDSLEHHIQLKLEGFEIPILPAFRPDNAMNVEDAVKFNTYIQKLEAVSNTAVTNYTNYLEALKQRHDFFAATGCMVSDHGLDTLYADQYTGAEIGKLFDKIRSSKALEEAEKRKFKSAMLVQFAEWDWEKGWVQQYHIGALRNNNSRMLQQLGADTGWDSIGDYSQAQAVSRFMDRMDRKNKLAKTILYNLNPADNELMASMAGNFNDGSVEGKIQYGSAWWFMDQKDGMTRQINALSNMGLLSRFIGMITDSRSFLSFPRHEYFRRILCNILGEEIENGELPNDIEWVGKIVKDICFFNAMNYFKFQTIARATGVA